MRRPLLAAVVAAAALSANARAADDPADIAFWISVRDSANPAELQAYVAEFPHGRFVGLARVRLRELAGRAAAPRPAAAPNIAPASMASVVPTHTRLRLVEPAVVDVDARSLAAGSNHRLIVVRAGTPDVVTDTMAFAEASTPIPPSRTRVSLPIGAPGPSEVRLYYIPRFASEFVVAARAVIAVAPGYPGAVLVSTLVREAGRTNPVRFEARYRDRTITVQGQFLRVQPRNVDELGWETLLGPAYVQKPYVAMFVGRLGAERRADGAPTELLCLMPAEDKKVLDRVALLDRGEPVVLRGTPSTWQSVFGASAVVFSPCAFVPSAR